MESKAEKFFMALSYPFASYIFASEAHAWIRGLSQQAGMGRWKFRMAGSWRSPNWKGNSSTKKNSMGSYVDFSGEYRQTPQIICGFLQCLRDSIWLGIPHRQRQVASRSTMSSQYEDPKSYGKFSWNCHEVSSCGSLPLWMTQMSLLLEMIVENL